MVPGKRTLQTNILSKTNYNIDNIPQPTYRHSGQIITIKVDKLVDGNEEVSWQKQVPKRRKHCILK